MDYQKAKAYLNSFINLEKQTKFDYNRLKLFRVRSILGFLGNPQRHLRVIKVAGTKGKGSTANYINSILICAGYKTGLYTSPHLHDCRERIKVNNRLITKKELVESVGAVKKAVKQHMASGKRKPTFFEIYTICALRYFYTQKTDFVVLEAGLGGRLDATNVAKGIISVLTAISYEHMDKLGTKLTSIAYEKASIIDKNSYAISAYQRPSAMKVIKSLAKDRKAKLYIFGRDYTCRKKKMIRNGQQFFYSGILGNSGCFSTKLFGEHQLENASCAAAAAEILALLGYRINNESIKKGIAAAQWAGRLETVKHSPRVVLDGAQNKASMQALIKALKTTFTYKKLIMVLGISADKDISGICRVVAAAADKIIITKSTHLRAAPPDIINECFKRLKKTQAAITHSLKDALRLGCDLGGKNDLIVCCGSLFVVAEARRLLRRKKVNLK